MVPTRCASARWRVPAQAGGACAAGGAMAPPKLSLKVKISDT
jgi:hypothetical protein